MLKKIMTVGVMWSALFCFAGVEVNTATEAELDSINGIGPAMSSKILAERKKGDFKNWNDFMGRVKGVREANATKFSAQGMMVNSAAFINAAPASSAKK
jgi:competence protein ComEA